MTATLSAYDRQHIGTILAGSGDWFSAILLRLIAKSDLENRNLLRQVYPNHVKAYEEWVNGKGA